MSSRLASSPQKPTSVPAWPKHGKRTKLPNNKKSAGKGRWTPADDKLLREATSQNSSGQPNFSVISDNWFDGKRSSADCQARWKSVLAPGFVKGPWSGEEDNKILTCMAGNGITKWADLAATVPGRTAKQCRERWSNHLNPSLKHGPWTDSEDAVLRKAQREHGNSWSAIAKFIPGRSENAIKNRWHSRTHQNSSASKDRKSMSAAALEESLYAGPLANKRKIYNEENSFEDDIDDDGGVSLASNSSSTFSASSSIGSSMDYFAVFDDENMAGYAGLSSSSGDDDTPPHKRACSGTVPNSLYAFDLSTAASGSRTRSMNKQPSLLQYENDRLQAEIDALMLESDN